jgi:uncharacterized protein with transglutaminase domain
MQTDDDTESRRDWLLIVLLALPAAIVLGKLPLFPTSALFTAIFTLEDLPTQHLRATVEGVLSIPLGALVVVVFHTTLGIRVLSLFRPILLAIAFNLTGVFAGLAFLLPVLAVVALTRPLLRNARKYYPRLGVLLSLVAALLLIPLMLARWWHAEQLLAIASFPVIALCLTCESFARIATNDGLPEAAWRTVTTVAAALIILALTRVPGVMQLFFRFPELLLAQAGCILLISRYLAFQIFKGKNPLLAWRAAAVESAPGLPAVSAASPALQVNHPVGGKAS